MAEVVVPQIFMALRRGDAPSERRFRTWKPIIFRGHVRYVSLQWECISIAWKGSKEVSQYLPSNEGILQVLLLMTFQVAGVASSLLLWVSF